MNVYLNGRFLTQRTTGVQRFAIECVKKLDEIIGAKQLCENFNFILLIPSCEITTKVSFSNIKVKRVGKRQGHAWEQIDLPFYVKNKLLINLCNTGPMIKRNQLVVIHDTGVYGFPSAYSRSFRMWYKIIFKVISKRTKKIITVSQFSKDELRKYLRIPSSKIAVVMEGGEHIFGQEADKDFLEKNKLQNKAFVLAVSSLNPNKNFQAIIKAIEILGDTEYEVVIAGGTNSKIFKGTNFTELSPKIKHVGYVTDSELRTLYENASCFIYPSFYEGFGLPPLEAMTCECPVIVSNRASLPEVFLDAALYCNPEDPNDIAKKIKEIMNNKKLNQAMKVKGKQRAEHFNWHKCAEQLIEIIKGV